MVQAIENLTRISGRILARRPHPSLSDYEIATLKLERADPVPGKANLLAPLVGTDIDVAIPRVLLGNASPGAQLRCRAKRTPDGAMCEPHPDPGDFEVS